MPSLLNTKYLGYLRMRACNLTAINVKVAVISSHRLWQWFSKFVRWHIPKTNGHSPPPPSPAPPLPTPTTLPRPSLFSRQPTAACYCQKYPFISTTLAHAESRRRLSKLSVPRLLQLEKHWFRVNLVCFVSSPCPISSFMRKFWFFFSSYLSSYFSAVRKDSLLRHVSF